MEDKKEGYIKVTLDYAPKENGPEFDAWCEEHGFDPLGSGRRAWCGNLSTYFRGAAGVAYSPSGDMFLFDEDDVFASPPSADGQSPITS